MCDEQVKQVQAQKGSGVFGYLRRKDGHFGNGIGGILFHSRFLSAMLIIFC